LHDPYLFCQKRKKGLEHGGNFRWRIVTFALFGDIQQDIDEISADSRLDWVLESHLIVGDSRGFF